MRRFRLVRPVHQTFGSTRAKPSGSGRDEVPGDPLSAGGVAGRVPGRRSRSPSLSIVGRVRPLVCRFACGSAGFDRLPVREKPRRRRAG